MQKLTYPQLLVLLLVSFSLFSLGVCFEHYSQGHHKGLGPLWVPLVILIIGLIGMVIALLVRGWLNYQQKSHEKRLLAEAANPWLDPPETDETNIHFATHHTPFLRDVDPTIKQDIGLKDNWGPTIWNRPKPGRGYRKRKL